MLSKEDEILCSFLVNEAQQKDYKKDDWLYVLNSVISELLQDNSIEAFPQLVRLCLCIVIVGAECTEFFGSVFRMMCDWEPLKGPYWIIQEELLRHSCISIIKEGLSEGIGEGAHATTLMDSAKVIQIRAKLAAFLPAELTSTVRHEMLRQKARELRVEIDGLVESLDAEFDVAGAKSRVDEYERQFPLASFSAWFLDWAQTTLETCDKSAFADTAKGGGPHDDATLFARLEAIASSNTSGSAVESTPSASKVTTPKATEGTTATEDVNLSTETVLPSYQHRDIYRRTRSNTRVPSYIRTRSNARIRTRTRTRGASRGRQQSGHTSDDESYTLVNPLLGKPPPITPVATSPTVHISPNSSPNYSYSSDSSPIAKPTLSRTPKPDLSSQSTAPKATLTLESTTDIATSDQEQAPHTPLQRTLLSVPALPLRPTKPNLHTVVGGSQRFPTYSELEKLPIKSVIALLETPGSVMMPPALLPTPAPTQTTSVSQVSQAVHEQEPTPEQNETVGEEGWAEESTTPSTEGPPLKRRRIADSDSVVNAPDHTTTTATTDTKTVAERLKCAWKETVDIVSGIDTDESDSSDHRLTAGVRPSTATEAMVLPTEDLLEGTEVVGAGLMTVACHARARAQAVTTTAAAVAVRLGDCVASFFDPDQTAIF